MDDFRYGFLGANHSERVANNISIEKNAIKWLNPFFPVTKTATRIFQFQSHFSCQKKNRKNFLVRSYGGINKCLPAASAICNVISSNEPVKSPT